jgi:hypothetical protein
MDDAPIRRSLWHYALLLIYNKTIFLALRGLYENPRNNRKKNIIVILYCDSSVILKTESLYNTLCIYNIEPTESRDNYTVG